MDNSMKNVKIPARNYVTKNNRNRPARHRAVTDYRRHSKHRNQEML